MEYESFMKNVVWDVLRRPKGKSVVISKWLYKIEHVVHGSIQKYNERFIAVCFSRKEG